MVCLSPLVADLKVGDATFSFDADLKEGWGCIFTAITKRMRVGPAKVTIT